MTLEEWTGAQVDPSNGETPPSPDEWHDVAVPGRPERFAGADAVAYRTQFSDPRDSDETRAVLELAGLYAHARVWHNDELLGSHDAYFVPARFAFEPTDENEVIVECCAPEDRFGGVYDTDLVRDDQRVPGIWWDATVTTHPETYIADMTVSPRIESDSAVIDTTVTVVAGADIDERITLSVRPEGFRGGGMMERARVVADAGEQITVERAIDVREPSFWWPRGYGPQHYYTVRTKLGESEHVASTGLRTVSYGDDGLTVNGKRVAARGFNVLPSDDPASDVEVATEANANLLRAHAHVPSPEFYRACDDAGLLVWQDLPLTGPEAFDADRAVSLAEALATEYGHHPGLAAFGVHDNPTSIFAEPLGTGTLDRYRFRWRTWRSGYDRGPADQVAQAFPEELPVFPVSGEPGAGADSTTLYPGWRYGRSGDVNWLLDRNPEWGTIVGEFGAGALANANASDLTGFDQEIHDTRVGDDVAASQTYQAQVLKTVAEALRRRGTNALAAFALRDTGDAGMGVVDRNGAPKASFDALGASYESAVAVLNEYPTPGSRRNATVLNDRENPIQATVAWRAGDESGSVDVEVDPFERVGIGTISVSGSAQSVELELIESDGTSVSNVYPL